MAEAAAHLTDHVFPRLPVRQWVLSVPKRLRYYLQRDKGALNAALHIFLRMVQQSLQAHCPGAAQCDPTSLHLGAVALRPPLWFQPEHACEPRPPSHYLWAALIARIYEVFPLLCPMCGGQMRLIAFITFITFSADIHKILEHIGVDPEAPRIAPARGPPLWDDCGLQESQEQGEGVEAEPDWDLANQSPPEFPDDQRTDW
ncbi:hypothetical protein M2244_001032 [Rhodoferax antarcticus]|nr:hypothetical protein [Rhodoferax antarcticus]